MDHGQDYLVGSMKKDIQNLIIEGTKLAWESYKLEPYVQRCFEAFTRYNENVCAKKQLIFQLKSFSFRSRKFFVWII